MSKYRDITSYNLAVKIRSFKTVLVEGTTDKNVLSNFFLVKNYTENNSCRYFIDDVSIISSDPELSTLGNKEKIIRIAEKLSEKNEKLGYFVDREWDDVDFSNLDESTKVTQTEKTFFTRGHSIENYWFSSDAFVSFLQYAVPANITAEFLHELNQHFSSITLFSAAFSIAAKQGGVITRLDDLLERSDIECGPEGFRLTPDFNRKLLARQSDYDIVAACNNQVDLLYAQGSEALRWICHGHLGEQAIRACVARLALDSGIDSKTALDIERGDKSGKFRHDSKHITTYSREAVAPLNEILSWIRDTA